MPSHYGHKKKIKKKEEKKDEKRQMKWLKKSVGYMVVKDITVL